MSDTERLDWIMDRIDEIAAADKVLQHLGITDEWRLRKTLRKRSIEWRLAIDEAAKQ